MEPSPSLNAPGGSDAARARTAVVESLWPARGAPNRVLIGPGVEERSYAGPGETTRERELAKAIRDGSVEIVVLRKVSPPLLRALRTTPPALLVLTGDGHELEDAAALPTLAVFVLGPRAVLRVGDLASRNTARALACAHSAEELEGISRALGPRDLPLRLAPTPPWLFTVLEHPSLASIPVAGTLDHGSLSGSWIPWIRHRAAPVVLVPLGINAPSVDDDDDDALLTVVAAHALERRTGPVFPAPRVIAGVLDGLERRENPLPPTSDQLALWNQARRALPIIGAAPGMQTPDGAVPLQAPTAAFLAQRALLRARAHDEVLEGEVPDVPAADEEGLTRARELLRNAAEVLTDQESKVVLRGFGFDVTRQAVANSASGAAGFADRIGYPVVLKVLSPDLRRRTDVGGVVLSLQTASAVRRAYASIMDNVERSAPTARIDGVVVAEMVAGGIDIRCGARRLGNNSVVVYGRIEGAIAPIEPALALLPLRPEDALALAHAVLSRGPMPALRRQSDPDVPGLAAVFSHLSALFEHAPRVLSVDLGP
ncbi:MAG: acetate--CoA ligase family protein, partial [Nannocystaceae bacterium]|nr:acetate--CoA ligase family protein [Nannocystaceae bacterium]